MMMLLGFMAVRLRLFEEVARHRRLLIAIIVYGTVAGIVSILIAHFWHPQFASLRLGMGCRTLVFTLFDERFQGLAYAAALLKLELTEGRRQHLMRSFLELRPWPDAPAALK